VLGAGAAKFLLRRWCDNAILLKLRRNLRRTTTGCRAGPAKSLPKDFEIMSRVSSLSSPFLLGFDEIERVLDRVSKGADGYPPYNIERIARDGNNPDRLRITLAVAGFTMDDLQITEEDNQLVIRGRQAEDAQGRVFLHRGIAARQFQRAFVLAEGITVKGAWLDNGLLHIDLVRPEPEVRVRSIPITVNTKDGGEAEATPKVDPGVTRIARG
jgi:HSP20 family molecular chaperone IbpA